MKRVALVTGGASGSGLPVGRRPARAGHRVVVADVDAEAAVSGNAPSVIFTPLLAQQAAGRVPSSEAVARGVPADPMETGDDVAAPLYLVSAEAPYVTGQTASVNGGSFAGW